MMGYFNPMCVRWTHHFSVARGSLGEQLRFSAFLKELSEQLRAVLFQHAARDFHFVIQPRMIDHFKHRPGRSGFGIMGSINQARDASVDHGPGAHRAWLDRGVERAARQAMIADARRSITERNNFSMRRRIVRAEITVIAAPHDFAVTDN